MPLDPVIPFEPVSTEQIPEGDRWIAQVKWDGVRILTYSDGNEVRLFNRKRHERTMQYPELSDVARYCRAKSVILDGEMIALSDGKPSFHEVMKRDSLRKPQTVAAMVRHVPVTYMIFDMLYLDGRWVTGLPLEERQRLLRETVVQDERIQLVQNVSDPAALFAVTHAHDLEGIVCKHLDSLYAIGGKDPRWRKKKHFKDLLAVVGGVTLRHGTVNALLLGLYDENGDLIYIGHAGAGKLTVADWRAVTERAAALATGQRPFRNRPGRDKDAIWVKPELTVKVRFMGWTPDGSIRQPTIQGFVDAPDAACTFGQTP